MLDQRRRRWANMETFYRPNMSRVQFKVDLFCIDFKQYINISIETKQNITVKM